MKSMNILFMVSILALLTACDAKKNEEASKSKSHEIECMENVKKALKDPLSAQFEGIVVGYPAPNCSGMVNAKNSMGGYVGFKKFTVFEDRSVYFNE
jgi:hypothetical protein